MRNPRKFERANNRANIANMTRAMRADTAYLLEKQKHTSQVKVYTPEEIAALQAMLVK
jgi:hypothetical protein